MHKDLAINFTALSINNNNNNNIENKGNEASEGQILIIENEGVSDLINKDEELAGVIEN